MKKIIFKVILNIVLICCIAYFIYDCIFYIQYLHEIDSNSKYLSFPGIFRNFKYEVIHITFSLIAIVFNIIALTLIDVKGISYLCGSALKEHKENKETLEEAKKQKKIEQLEKELNELKKNEH